MRVAVARKRFTTHTLRRIARPSQGLNERRFTDWRNRGSRPGCQPPVKALAKVGRALDPRNALDLHVAPRSVTDDIENLMWAAQTESTRTCEVCAHRAWLYRPGDWLITLCAKHAEVRDARPVRTDADINEAVPRLTDREMAFALSAGVPASAFTADERHKNEAYALASEEADEAEMWSWLSDAEIARLMVTSAADVNERPKRRALHAGRTRDGRYMYPGWRFDQQKLPLRGLPEVLAAARDEGPFFINSLVTAPSEALEGLSILGRLTSGREPGRAAAAIHASEMS